MPIPGREATPPPTIGKIGPYTVFVTPSPRSPPSPTKDTASPSPVVHNPPYPVVNPPPSPVVQPPPQQFYKVAPASPSDGSVMGFFRNAVVKVQNAHSSLDEHVAHWFGLNQSKYQWALDDYYETKGGDQVEAKAANNVSCKAQSV